MVSLASGLPPATQACEKEDIQIKEALLHIQQVNGTVSEHFQKYNTYSQFLLSSTVLMLLTSSL